MAKDKLGAASMHEVKIVRLAHGLDLPLPAYQTAGAAGLDLVAAVPSDQPLKLKRGAQALIPTGLIFELPHGLEAQVRPRSGLAAKHGVTVLNSPGTIDSDYRGEVQVLLINHGDKKFMIQRGDRIAQMVIAPVMQVQLTEASSTGETARGDSGFGSTGVAVATVAGPSKSTEKPAKSAAKPRSPVTLPRRSAATRGVPKR